MFLLKLVALSNHTRFIFIMKLLFTGGSYKTTTLHSFRPEYNPAISWSVELIYK